MKFCLKNFGLVFICIIQFSSSGNSHLLHYKKYFIHRRKLLKMVSAYGSLYDLKLKLKFK